MKRRYIKPDVEYLNFYTDEDIADVNQEGSGSGADSSSGFEEMPDGWD